MEVSLIRENMSSMNSQTKHFGDQLEEGTIVGAGRHENCRVSRFGKTVWGELFPPPEGLCLCLGLLQQDFMAQRCWLGWFCVQRDCPQCLYLIPSSEQNCLLGAPRTHRLSVPLLYF